MASLMVKCDCRERGLCRPCPVDQADLLPRGFLPWKQHVAPGLDGYVAVAAAFQAWKDTSCSHLHGCRFDFALGSQTVLQRIANDVRPTVRAGCALLEALDEVATYLYNVTALYKTGYLYETALEALASGQVASTVIAGEVSSRRAVVCIAQAAATAIIYQAIVQWI